MKYNVSVNKKRSMRTDQSCCHADHTHRSHGGLRHVKQVVQQRLILVIGEQIKLVQNKQDGLGVFST